MTNSSKPREIVLRVYQVGFGDCFLLTFRYGTPGQDDRFLLMDFGSTEKPKGVESRSAMLRQVAEDIQRQCKGKLHLVVATHRHADHINGFAVKDGNASGDIIKACQPELVLQPWTEDPSAPEDPRAKPFIDRLEALHALAWSLGENLEHLRKLKCYSPGVTKDLRRFAANNLGSKDVANKSAVENLRTMGRRPPRYLSYGSPLNLDLLPGVKVHVLGPPTLEQSPNILRQREGNVREFWQLLRTSGSLASDSDPLFDTPATLASEWAPQNARWLIHRLSSLRGEQLLGLVRSLDDVLNNTSLILLFEIGDQKLLFPGDAQWENWSYALNHPQEKDRNKKLLQGSTLYKVGHHGSRNATPKSLWNLIESKSLLSVLSTKPDRHGEIDRQTEVPRATLVEELRKYGRFFSTQDMGWSVSDKGEPPSRTFTFKPDYGIATPAQESGDAPTSEAHPS